MDNQQPIEPSGNEQPANRSPFFAPATNREESNIQRHYRDLHETIEKMMLSSGSAFKIELLKDLWVGWSQDVFGEGSPDEAITVKREKIDVTYDVMGLMVSLAQIGESWQSIRLLEERYKTSNDREQQSGTSH